MAWLPALGLLLLSSTGATWANFRPQEGDGPLAAVFPPWWTPAAAFGAAATADVAIVRTGAWQTLLIVQPGESATVAASRLRAAGAWLVLNGRVAGGCAGRG